MVDLNFTEVVGYIGSLLVVVSFLMKDIQKLRIGSIIGSATFIVYGVLIDFSIPIIFTNACILLINLYHLVKSNSKKA
jgi:hypothetical protein